MDLWPIPIFATSDPDWSQEAQHALADGKNFFFLEESNVDVADHIPIFRERPLNPLEKWSIYSFKDIVPERDFGRLINAFRAGQAVLFVKQKDLRLPVQGRYIVYCEVRGIVSCHDSFESAHQACTRYVQVFPLARRFREAGVYEASPNNWQQLQLVC